METKSFEQVMDGIVNCLENRSNWKNRRPDWKELGFFVAEELEMGEELLTHAYFAERSKVDYSNPASGQKVASKILQEGFKKFAALAFQAGIPMMVAIDTAKDYEKFIIMADSGFLGYNEDIVQYSSELKLAMLMGMYSSLLDAKDSLSD